ncbi:MAG: nucleotidyltransferase domain-containing protein [Candidatus Marinimicrobia bacterium]|nr:nucleotidyltransferase domain-containing protein [Candidatus Neomarinimicrobiota bacterium]
MYTEKDFTIITDVFREHVPGLKALILFGSYARGTAQDDSDADIAAIVEKPVPRAEKLTILNKIWQVLGRMGYRTDIIFKDIEQFEDDKQIPVTMAYEIDQEGKLLWMKN